MRKLRKMSFLILNLAILLMAKPGLAKDDSGNIQFDIQGDAHYSRYNFTDITKPYDGVDGWAEFKIAYWVDKDKALSPYISVIPSFTSESEFWWQRNYQAGVGFQWYPVETFIPRLKDDTKDEYKLLRSTRIFVLAAIREYYDEPNNVDPEDNDIQIGADHYFDNLFGPNIWTIATWMNASYRKTNFSLDDYEAFLWTGNTKLGPKWNIGDSKLFPYAVAEWIYVPKYDEHWWENSLRLGGGIRFYPKADEAGGFLHDLMQRFHIYAEVIHNVAWLGDSPPDKVNETDYRVGFGFSTGGFFKE